MAYVVLPNSGQSLGVSRPQIKENFNLIQTVFDVNHYDFNVANAGKHKYVVMPIEASAPTTASGEGSLYTKTINSISQVFYIHDGIGASEVQLTGPTPVNATNGSTFLPGGLLLQWGQLMTTGASVTIPFTPNFSSPPYSIYVQSVNLGTNRDIFKVASLLSNQAVVNIYISTNGNPEGTNQLVCWSAIGPRT